MRIIINLIGFISLGTQTIQSANYISISGLSPTDCWNVDFTLQKEQRIYMLGIIKNLDGKELVNLRSESFRGIAGRNVLNREEIKTAKLKFEDNVSESSVLSTGNFPKGRYEVCTQIIDASNNSELTKICRYAEVGDLLLKKGEKKPSAHVSFYGSAAVDYIYSSPKSFYTELPSSYTRLQLEQGLSLYSVPIAGQFRYSTEKTPVYQDVDMFSLRFDRNRFERNIKDLILRKVAESQLKKVAENADDLQKLTEFENLETELKNQSSVLLDSKQKNMEDELKILSNQNTSESKEKYVKLKRTYEKILVQKRKLEGLKERFEQLTKLKKVWEESGRLEELKNMAYNPPDLSDPKIVAAELSKYGAFKGINRFLFGIQELSIGTAFPVYTPLTLNGTQIFGANLEWNPGIFYVAACGGKVHSSISLQTDSNAVQFKQNMAALRFGFGKSYGTHISFSALRFWDSKESISLPPGQELFPESSWVGSTDFALSFGKNRLVEFKGEIAGLLRNQNTNDTLSPVLSIQSEFVKQHFNPNFSTSIDAAASAGLHFNFFQGKTKVEVSGNFVGPGFIHPGVFGLRNDLLRQEFRVTQFTFQRQLKFSGNYSSEYDNFSESKGITTDMKQYGLDIESIFKSFPQIRLNLNRIELNNASFYYYTNVVNLFVNKSYKLGKSKPGNTSINAMYYFTDTDSTNQKINSYYISLSQFLSLPAGFFINLGAQYSKNSVATLFTQHTGYSAQIGKQFFKRIKLHLGVNFNEDASDDKLGFNAELSGWIIQNLQFNIRAFRNNFSQYPGVVGRYQENHLEAGLKYNW